MNRHGDLPSSKLKKGMLNMDDRNVPGRKTEPSMVSVFIELFSRVLACAKTCCWDAISMLTLDSTWVIMLCSFLVSYKIRNPQM